MSPEKLLAKAIWRAKTLRNEPRRIPIRDLDRCIVVEVMRLEPDPKPIVPPENPPAHPSLKTILETVADYYGIAIIKIVSPRRSLGIVRPRQIAMYLARELTPLSYPVIARFIGDRDHTTAMHSANKIEKLIKEDEKIRTDVEFLKLKLSVCSRPSVDRTAGVDGNKAQPEGA